MLNLAKRSQKEIQDITAFCQELKKYAFLQKYQYNKNSKTIYAAIQKNGNVTNFFTGDWFERFVYLKACALLDQEGFTYSSVVNAKVSLPNEDDFELDMVFLVNEQALWIECKTGNIGERINKYAELRRVFGLPQQRALIVNLGMPDDRAVGLSSVYGITVTNHLNFLHHFRIALGVSNENDGGISHPVLPVPGSSLSTLLNKANLRPILEHRSAVLAAVIHLVDSMSHPITLYEVKERLATQFAHQNPSKSQLQDILNAAVRSGCLIDDDGNAVFSITEPFCRLVADTVAEIEHQCQYSYIHAILVRDQHYFDFQQGLEEYKHVVGMQPDMRIVSHVKERLAE